MYTGILYVSPCGIPGGRGEAEVTLTLSAGITAALLVGSITSVFAATALPEETEVNTVQAEEDRTMFLCGLSIQIDIQEEIISNLGTQIAEKEEQMEGGKKDEDLAWELESLKETKYAYMVHLEDMKSIEHIVSAYGAYGITADISGGYWEDWGLYYGSEPIRYLVDEGDGGVLWSDPGNRGLIAEVLRDEAGGITGLEVTEAS